MTTSIKEELDQAIKLEKKAYTDYVTSYSKVSITALVKGGIQLEKAASIVKEACLSDAIATRISNSISLLEKIANYVDSVETKLEGLQQFAEQVKEAEEIHASKPMNKLAQIGFSDEELAYINSLPDTIIEKVANVTTRPWEMGGGVGMAIEGDMDPLLAFLLS